MDNVAVKRDPAEDMKVFKREKNRSLLMVIAVFDDVNQADVDMSTS